MIGPSAECVWGCGRSDFNVEHVIGQQFAKALDLPYPMAMMWADYSRIEEQLLEVVLRDRVCTGCNGGFMKRLDDRMRRVMGSSITDATPTNLTEDQQTRVARWAFKVGLLLMLWVHDECARHPELLDAVRVSDPNRHADPLVPLGDFAYVGKRHLPPPHARIWLGAASEELPDYFSSVSALSRPASPRPERLGYYVIFALRHLVVYILAGTPEHGDVLSQALGRFVAPEQFDPHRLVPIWPARHERRHWPPSTRLTAEDVAKLTGNSPRWGKGQPPAEVEPEAT
ncbi:MAG: hypothetical protein ACTHM1_00835 [Solirubrobacteraceae bacterium]